MAKIKRVSKNEFRYNYAQKHVNYIFEQEGNKYHGLGLTTKKKFNNKKNYKLLVNPEKGRTDDSYLRHGVVTNNIKVYEKKPKKKFSFSNADLKVVKAKIRNYKKNRKYKSK